MRIQRETRVLESTGEITGRTNSRNQLTEPTQSTNLSSNQLTEPKGLRTFGVGWMRLTEHGFNSARPRDRPFHRYTNKHRLLFRPIAPRPQAPFPGCSYFPRNPRDRTRSTVGRHPAIVPSASHPAPARPVPKDPGNTPQSRGSWINRRQATRPAAPARTPAIIALRPERPGALIRVFTNPSAASARRRWPVAGQSRSVRTRSSRACVQSG